MLGRAQYKEILSKEIISKSTKEYSQYLLESSVIQIIDGIISLILFPFGYYCSLFFQYNNQVLKNLINIEDKKDEL